MIRTARLALVPASGELLTAALDGPEALAAGLGARVPPTWPPEFVDPPALEFTRDRLALAPDQRDWWMFFVVLASTGDGPVLVGTAGYKGPPTDGAVEIGYSIVSDHRRRGYASEAVRGLLARAFGVRQVHRVVAETLPELAPSIAVLRKCGFAPAGEGSEPGVVRFEITRHVYEEAGAA